MTAVIVDATRVRSVEHAPGFFLTYLDAQACSWDITTRMMQSCPRCPPRKCFSPFLSAIRGSRSLQVSRSDSTSHPSLSLLPLADLLRPFFPISDRAPNVLELFARTTLAGLTREGSPAQLSAQLSEAEVKAEERGVWMSVGNEAIKFNTLETGTEGEAKGWLRRDKQ